MGELGKCARCFSIFFIVSHVFFMLTGLAILSIGFYLLLVTRISFTSRTGDDMLILTGPAMLITCGVTAIAATVLGILGGTMLQRRILVIYIIGLVIIILLNMVTGILCLVYQDLVMTLARRYRASRLDYAIKLYGSESDANDILADVQGRFACCGSTGPQSWIDMNPIAIEENSNQPPLCVPCNSTIDPMTCGQYTFQNSTEPFMNITFEAFNKGCVGDFQDQAALLDIAANVVVGGFVIAFATCIFGIIGIPVSIGLICCITKSGQRTVV